MSQTRFIDHDLERYYLGMTEETQDYVDLLRAALLDGMCPLFFWNRVSCTGKDLIAGLISGSHRDRLSDH
jgi:hypothetical protein